MANENVLIGFDKADDAGVYKLAPDCALVQTVDFFTPIVDDPVTFGAIAAANSLSNIYAMGARPLSALSILAYPSGGDLDDLAGILKGGSEKIYEAGCALLGGHSIADNEIKFGYAITGTVHPDYVKSNAAARPGDVLLFTKKIGTGVITTAHKRGWADPAHVDAAVQSMLELNRQAAEAMSGVSVHAVTDVSGFGLIGHAREIAVASGVTLELVAADVQFLPGAIEYARRGAIPGGLKNNREFASCAVQSAAPVDDLLYDPQTSGGLLIALPEPDAARYERVCPAAYRIGRVLPAGDKPIRVL